MGTFKYISLRIGLLNYVARRGVPPGLAVSVRLGSEEGRPAVIEVLCDECEKELNFSDFEETVRNELLLTLGAR